jgi:hypothetical protein
VARNSSNADGTDRGRSRWGAERPHKRIKPGDRSLRAKSGGGRSPRALSRWHHVGRSRRLAGQVLPDATHRGMRWYRSHSGTVPALSDRNFSSEASTPGSVTICRWFARRTGAGTPTSICFRAGTLTTGTAAAFGCALAPCDGSDLLPLRLRLTCSWVTRFRAAQARRTAGCCLSRAAPRRVVSLARPAGCAGRAFWRVRPLPNTSLRTGRTVAAVTLWVTASVQGPKLALNLTRPGCGFYSRLAAQFLCRKTGSVATPSRGPGDICLSRLAP